MNQYVPSSWRRLDRLDTMMKGGRFNTRLLEQKVPFMGTVILLVIVQLLVTFFVMDRLYVNVTFQELLEKNKMYMIFTFLLPFVIILVLAFVPMPMYIKLLLFTIFSVTFGILLSQARRYMTPELVKAAIVATIGIFISMFMVGIILAGFGYDLLWLGIILFVLLIVLLIIGIVMLFTHPDQKVIRARAAAIIILFAIYVLYDTNQIIMRNYYGDYVTAGIDYYLDVVNIFLALIQVMAGSD